MTRTRRFSGSEHSMTWTVAGKRVLVRADLNVPMEDGKITDATRIDRILGNIREISEKEGKGHSPVPSRPPQERPGTRRPR